MLRPNLKNFPKKDFKKKVRVVDPDYSFDFHDFEFNAVAVCSINEKPIHKNDRLYVMQGDECRGIAYPQLFPPTNQYLWYLMTYSNEETELGLHLEYYSYKQGKVLTSGSWGFVNNGIAGEAMDPVEIKFKKELK
jgi:hypothetical protein